MNPVMKKKPMEKDRENVAAALDLLDASANNVAKATSTVRRRIEELDELVAHLDAELQTVTDRHKAEMQTLKEQYLKENTTLSTRLQAAEEKLRKVQQTLT